VTEAGASDVDASDEQLLVGSRVHPELFAAFYQRHGRNVLVFLARRTFDPELAADLTAETFAQAFGSRMKFRAQSPGGAQAWLYTIARRELARSRRRRRVETKARARLGMPVRTLAEDDYERIERLIDFESVGRAVAGALNRLSAEQREAVTLRVVEGRSYAEVAQVIGCSELAARARVSRGLRRLGALLEPRKGARECQKTSSICKNSSEICARLLRTGQVPAPGATIDDSLRSHLSASSAWSWPRCSSYRPWSTAAAPAQLLNPRLDRRLRAQVVASAQFRLP
jgi:RNA polymerase sigma factor (sigma-70 family)